MTTNKSKSDAAAEIHTLVQHLLDEGASAAELSYVLAAWAFDLGLHITPRPEHALTVVLAAMWDVAAHHAGADDGDNDEQVDPADPAVLASATVH